MSEAQALLVFLSDQDTLTLIIDGYIFDKGNVTNGGWNLIILGHILSDMPPLP